MHGSHCSLRYYTSGLSGFLESGSSKIRGSDWPRSASDPDGPVRRNSRAPRSRFVSGRCLGAKDEKLLSSQLLTASFWKLVSSNVRAFGILKIRSAPWHLFHLQPPSFDGFLSTLFTPCNDVI